MTFAGAFPYGGPTGAVPASDVAGTTTLQGGGEGVEFFLTIDAPFVTRAIASFTDIGRILPSAGSGAIPISGGGVATIQLLKNGSVIDAGMGNLNFNPAPDVSFTITDSPAGQGNIALAYPGAGGNNGALYQPARADHAHAGSGNPTLMGTKSYDGSAGGGGPIAITSTSDFFPTQFNGTSPVLLSGVTYDIVCWGGLEVNAPSAGYLLLATFINTTVGAHIGEGTAGGERTLCPSLSLTVTGTGATIAYGFAVKVTTGSGSFNSGSVTFQAIPRY